MTTTGNNFPLTTSIIHHQQSIQTMTIDSSENSRRRVHLCLLLSVLFVFISLRAVCWHETVLLEDTDSIVYLRNIDGFRNLDFAKYLSDADTCPFYPFWGAVFSLPGWSSETGARLASLVFSVFMLLSLYAIGRRFLTTSETWFGLLLVCFCPTLIPLSIGVITEPSYVATIYIGLFIYWRQYENPTVGQACLLGIIFGAGFLNRLEGILYFGIVPFWQWAYFIFSGRRHLPFTRVAKWTAAYLLVFVVVISPQIYKVSAQMGKFALNGRQVWSVVYNIPGPESKTEKLFGLTYSQKELNINYLAKHPEILSQYQTKVSPFDYLKTIRKEFNTLYQKRLGEMLGALCMMLFGFGLVYMLRRKQYYPIFLILSFICFFLTAPLLHNVATRHIFGIVPMILLVAGAGAGFLKEEILPHIGNGAWSRAGAKLIFPVLILCLLAVWAHPMRKALRPPKHTREYSPMELKAPAAIIREATAARNGEAPEIAAERGFLAYFAGGKQYYLPFAPFEQFTTYCRLNGIDFFYLNHDRVKSQGYPFYEAFVDNTPPGFKALYNGVDFYGNRTTLFEIKGISESGLDQ